MYGHKGKFHPILEADIVCKFDHGSRIRDLCHKAGMQMERRLLPTGPQRFFSSLVRILRQCSWIFSPSRAILRRRPQKTVHKSSSSDLILNCFMIEFTLRFDIFTFAGSKDFCQAYYSKIFPASPVHEFSINKSGALDEAISAP